MTGALLILNDPPYGSERSYNGLRLATSLAGRPEVEVRVFLIADAVACARRGQQVPKGYYNIEAMIGALVKRGGAVGVCGSCMDARGIAEADLAEGCRRGNMDELTAWTLWADRVLAF